MISGAKPVERFEVPLGAAPSPSPARRSVVEPWLAPPDDRHAVSFYETDAFLCRTVSALIGAGLAAGDATIVIVTEEHRRAIEQHLENSAIDLSRACANEQLTILDAGGMLRMLMVDGEPSRARFETHIGDLVRRARTAQKDRSVRAFGELVDLLCKQGKADSAARLEAMWDELVERESISLLCAYAIDSFRSIDDEAALERVCRGHSRVLPGDVFSGLDGNDHRDRRLVALQQRTNALEAEVRQRSALERDLRRALTSLEQREAELRRAEVVAQHERTKLRQLFLQSPAVIVLLRGPEHTVEFVNEAAAQLFGRDVPIGVPVRDALPTTPALRVEKLDHVYATGTRYVGEAESAHRDWDGAGRPYERFFNVVYDAYYDAEGNVEGVMFFGFDVSEEARVRRKLEAAAEELECANRTKDDFLATVSHELRTPLNAIMGWVRMLRGNTLPVEKRGRALETIERNATVQTQLIEDLLDVSRIISGKLRLDVRTVDLAVLVDNALEAVRPAAAAKGISLRQRAEKDAGPILGDPERLQQVVWNLLTNAVKFTSSGGSVEVEVRKRGGIVEVAVSDDGQGIGPEFLPHVFERFRQADGTVGRKHGGLGLGLAIVRHLVELHGGRVNVASEGVSKGAVFTVCLPISSARAFGFERAPALRLVSSPDLRRPKELDGVRAVVVDDEPDARELLAELLSSCDAEVWTAASATEAIELVEEHRPDVLVSDIGMPGEDGYSLIKRLRALPPERGGRTPAVALTAYARVEDRTKALVAGFHMHVPKPVEATELLAVLTSLTTMFRRG